jgi:mobilization protein MobC
MAADAIIHCRVSLATKMALHAAAERQQLTESGLVKRILELMLQTAPSPELETVAPSRPARLARLYVRLNAVDWASLRERAAKRNTALATYAANVLRAHLQARAQLLNVELAAMKDSARELRAIGVNLNQIAQRANQDGRISGPTREDLRAFLKVCTGLRDHIVALLRANAKSWGVSDV